MGEPEFIEQRKRSFEQMYAGRIEEEQRTHQCLFTPGMLAEFIHNEMGGFDAVKNFSERQAKRENKLFLQTMVDNDIDLEKKKRAAQRVEQGKDNLVEVEKEKQLAEMHASVRVRENRDKFELFRKNKTTILQRKRVMKFTILSGG